MENHNPWKIIESATDNETEQSITNRRKASHLNRYCGTYRQRRRRLITLPGLRGAGKQRKARAHEISEYPWNLFLEPEPNPAAAAEPPQRPTRLFACSAFHAFLHRVTSHFSRDVPHRTGELLLSRRQHRCSFPPPPRLVRLIFLFMPLCASCAFALIPHLIPFVLRVFLHRRRSSLVVGPHSTIALKATIKCRGPKPDLLLLFVFVHRLPHHWM